MKELFADIIGIKPEVATSMVPEEIKGDKPNCIIYKDYPNEDMISLEGRGIN